MEEASVPPSSRAAAGPTSPSLALPFLHVLRPLWRSFDVLREMADDAADEASRVSVDRAFLAFVRDHADSLDDFEAWRGAVVPRHRPDRRLDLAAVFRSVRNKRPSLFLDVERAWRTLTAHLLSPEVLERFEKAQAREREKMAPALAMAEKLGCERLVESDPNVAAFFLAIAEAFHKDGLPPVEAATPLLENLTAGASVEDMVASAQKQPGMRDFVTGIVSRLGSMRGRPGMSEAAQKIFAAISRSPNLPPEAASLLGALKR